MGSQRGAERVAAALEKQGLDLRSKSAVKKRAGGGGRTVVGGGIGNAFAALADGC
jgi:hypothetical protein